MPDISEEKIQAAATDKQLEPAVPSTKSSRKSILALSMFALGLNATAAVYTLSPSDFALPNVSGLMAKLLPNQRAQAPIPEAVVAALKDIQSVQQQQAGALKDIQSAQQQQAGALQENASLLLQHTVSLQQSTALLQQDKATTFDSLRKSITDEQVDVKKISFQLSTLTAKVDSLQNAITTEITSSITKGHARARLSGAARKRMARQAKPVGAPLMLIQSPEG